MKCACCGLEMVIYKAEQSAEGKKEIVYSCRNKLCPEFDPRLKRKTEQTEGTK